MAARRRRQKSHHGVPHPLPARVHIAVWEAHGVQVGTEPETTQNRRARLLHQRLHCGRVFIDFIYGRLDEDGVMDGGANLDSNLNSENTAEPKHICPVGLHRKVANRARVRSAGGSQSPAENCMKPTV